MEKLNIAGMTIESPDADGDFEISMKDNNRIEIFRFLTKEEAKTLIEFISSHLND